LGDNVCGDRTTHVREKEDGDPTAPLVEVNTRVAGVATAVAMAGCSSSIIRTRLAISVASLFDNGTPQDRSGNILASVHVSATNPASDLRPKEDRKRVASVS
jgi:hypothetical protein